MANRILLNSVGLTVYIALPVCPFSLYRLPGVDWLTVCTDKPFAGC